MKKLFIFLIMLLLLPITTFASSIKITNIEVVNTDGETTYTDSTIDGLTANLNFKVYDVEDSIKYKITIKNESDTAFNINLNTNSETDKYFDYEYTGDTKIEAGKEGTITVSAEYVKYLSRDDIDNSEYSKNLTLNITSDPVTETNTNENPNTGLDYKVILLFSIILVIIGITFYNKFNNKSIYKTFILLPLLIIPFIVEANDSEVLTVKINSKINVKPFVIRFSPSTGVEINTGDAAVPVEIDGGTTADKYSLSDIIEIEIPLKYNSMYGTDAYTANIVEASVDGTSIMPNLLAGTKIDRNDTTAIDAAKAAIEVEGVYITYFTTSRVTIYDLNLYLKNVDKTVRFRLEYDESTGDTLIVDTDTLLYADAMNYMIEQSPDKLTCESNIWECTNSKNEEVITSDVTKAIDADYLDSLNQDYILKEYNERLYVYPIEAYTKAGNYISKAVFGKKGTTDTNYYSTLKWLIKTENDIYTYIGKVGKNGTLQQDEDFVYYSYDLN